MPNGIALTHSSTRRASLMTSRRRAANGAQLGKKILMLSPNDKSGEPHKSARHARLHVLRHDTNPRSYIHQSQERRANLLDVRVRNTARSRRRRDCSVHGARVVGTSLDIGNDLTIVARIIASAIGLGIFIYALPVRVKLWT
jgi:hypothetical protein